LIIDATVGLLVPESGTCGRGLCGPPRQGPPLRV